MSPPVHAQTPSQSAKFASGASPSLHARCCSSAPILKPKHLAYGIAKALYCFFNLGQRRRGKCRAVKDFVMRLVRRSTEPTPPGHQRSGGDALEPYFLFQKRGRLAFSVGVLLPVHL